MSSHPPLAGVDELDDATIDGGLDGVVSGSGMLAAMLAERGLLPSGVHLPGAASFSESSFASQDFLASLSQYEAEQRLNLYGQGLVLADRHSAPPFALPGVMGGNKKSGQTGLKSAETGPYPFEESEQAAWLINATLVRASLTMAGFALGRPELKICEPESPHRFLFVNDSRAECVLIDRSTSPLSLHREVRIAIQRTWRTRIAAAATQVATEYERALQTAGQSAESAVGAKDLALRAITSSTTFEKMRRSSALFIDIKGVAATCAAVVESLDRVAIRNGLRHGATGLSWLVYEIHRAPAIQAELASFEHRGALAYAGYSPGLIALISANASKGVGFGFAAASGDHTTAVDDAKFTSRFLSAFDAELSPPVRVALENVSPRYLSAVVLGQGGQQSLAQTYRLLRRSGATAITAEMMGKRLAWGLNEVAASPRSKDFLPWMRVLSSESVYELLQHEASDAQVTRALKASIQFANSRRAKGFKVGDVMFTMPSTEELLATPAGQEAQSLVAMFDAGSPRAQAQATKTALAVLMDFVREMGAAGGQWRIELAGIRPNGDIKLGVRHEGTRPPLWSLVTITSHTSPKFSRTRLERVNEDSYDFALATEQSSGQVDPLVFSIRSDENMRFKPLVSSPTRSGTNFELGVHSLTSKLAEKVMMRDGASTAAPAAIHRLQQELPTQLKALALQLQTAIKKRPLQAACLFPGLATCLLSGGDLGGRRNANSPGATSTLRYARACVGAENAPGLQLLCARSGCAAARSSGGLSVLDIALDAVDQKYAAAALAGLRLNGKLAESELADLVQASAGRLIERHPDLLPRAVELGLILDYTLLTAWSALHPHRKSPELEAQIADLRMNQVIGQRLAPAAANEPDLALASVTDINTTSARRSARRAI
ncbi:hypothetical protein ABIC83_002612 [Roseateles asaccharophilus]|uniref:hypothetical protein n=1 Tax=Roseateles asaccharophilus TaxID=582607 RepID=UPI003835F5F1